MKPGAFQHRRKGKHIAKRKFPRKQTLWISHRSTHDGAVHRPDVWDSKYDKTTSNFEEREEECKWNAPRMFSYEA